MANQQLVDFIKASLAQNQSHDQIRQSLLQSGWQGNDIAEAFGVASPGGSIAVPEAPVKYAGFWVRWVASMIDGLIVGIPLGILFGIFDVIFDTIESPFGLLSYIIGWGYFIFMTNKYEATFGKKLVGIKVKSDKAEKLTLGQVILRETVGKIVSAIIVMIGYIMAGFTERKQALHDKIAGTVVVYKDPNKKVAIWVIIIALILPIIAMIGLSSSVALISLNTARSKAGDASVRATLQSMAATTMIYYDDHQSFIGFGSDLGDIKLPECSGKSIINISPDGQHIAIFAKSCSDDKKYFCVGDSAGEDIFGGLKEVSKSYAMSGKTVCALEK